MVELQVPFEVHLVQTFCLDEQNEDRRSEVSCPKSHSYHITAEVILKAKTQACFFLMLFLLDLAVLCSLGECGLAHSVRLGGHFQA